MNMDDQEIIENFVLERNLKHLSAFFYKDSIKIYKNFNGMTLNQLLNEAENEEEQGIRWKHRTLKKRLINFRNYLQNEYLVNSARSHFNRILTVYRHHEIELHTLPAINMKNSRKANPINFKDLPDKEIIKQTLKITNPLMRAIILFMSSSGCGRRETLNLTVQDFIEATSDYHDQEDIYGVINVLRDRDDVIPTFYIKRQKTNKFYYTFCSPEATVGIVDYLLSRKTELSGSDVLFKVNQFYFSQYFIEVNDTLKLGKAGTYNRFRSHMLRKFHASQLYNDGVPLEVVDSLQGRGKDSTHSAYFMEDPEKLKETYVEHLDCLTINLDVNSLDLKSPEYVRLEAENEKNKKDLEYYKGVIERQEDVNREVREHIVGLKKMLDLDK